MSDTHGNSRQRMATAARAIAGALAAACVLVTAEAGTAEPDTARRVEELERENAEIRDQLEQQRTLLEAIAGDAREAAPEDVPAVDAQDGLFAVKSKFPITLSGFLKGDLLWNAPRLNSTSAPRFALSEPGHDDDDQFTATVQHSRIIARIGEIDLGRDYSALGHVELDLFNLSDTGDTNFNNNQLRLRQLFASVSHEGFTLLVGQAWDVFSPLNVSSLNTNGNYWFGGNAGFRRPQVRGTKSIEVGEGAFQLAASVNANVGVTVTDGGRTLDSGRDSGLPVFEGSAEYSLPWHGGRVRLGVSGLWGEEDVDGVERDIDQWAFGAHVVVPLAEWVTLMGEFQMGENTDAFLTGGGINVATGDEISSHSGWVQASFKPMKRLSVNLLAGIDDLDRSDVASGARFNNMVAGANVRYQVFEPFTIGLEYDRFDTDFRDARDEEVDMVWASAILSF